MSESTPDISRVISVIMENPKLIEEISALAKASGESDNAEAPTDSGAESPAMQKEDTEASAEPTYTSRSSEKNRTRLLSAFKPYLSSERAKAVDSMITIADILDAMKAR